MPRSISSPPGANRFRSLAVLILVLICISVFLGYSQYLTGKAEQVARERVITEIRQAMAMMLYHYAVKGKLGELQKFDRDNPFTLMAAYRPLPLNYHGAIKKQHAEMPAGWYFDLSTRRVLWVGLSRQRQYYELRFGFDDRNSDGRFNPGTETVLGLEIKKAS